jgi:hypothetical protein
MIPASIRVHAASAVIPICANPQILDVYTTDQGKTISIYRISGERRVLIDRGIPMEVWERWLPICWKKSNILRGAGVLPENSHITWSAEFIHDSNSIRIALNPVSGAPPVDFLADELAMAIISISLPSISLLARIAEFPEHNFGQFPTPIVRHNNKIFQLSQEVEEIDL